MSARTQLLMLDAPANLLGLILTCTALPLFACEQVSAMILENTFFNISKMVDKVRFNVAEYFSFRLVLLLACSRQHTNYSPLYVSGLDSC